MKKDYSLLLMLLIIAIACLCSCSDSGERQGAGISSYSSFDNMPAAGPLVRAKILENGTITYCYLTPEQKATLRPRDTVWLNMSTHQIDDTSNITMKAVIFHP